MTFCRQLGGLPSKYRKIPLYLLNILGKVWWLMGPKPARRWHISHRVWFTKIKLRFRSTTFAQYVWAKSQLFIDDQARQVPWKITGKKWSFWFLDPWPMGQNPKRSFFCRYFSRYLMSLVVNEKLRFCPYILGDSHRSKP